jgi:hypothetical protein
MTKEDKFAEEMLTDEELDNVAGGTFEELKADVAALEPELPIAIKLSHPSGIGDMRIYDREAVSEVFRSCGVSVNFDYDKPSEYFIYGKKVSRDEAITHTKEALRKRFQ